MDDVVEGSCGVVLPNTTIKIVDVATGQSVGPNQTGELCVKGPQVMKGYLDNPQATAETIREDWLHSGDIGYYDDKGHLYIVDRLKELIKVKGFQVAPAELEDLLRTMPGVADVGVVGVPHERLVRTKNRKRHEGLTKNGFSLDSGRLLGPMSSPRPTRA